MTVITKPLTEKKANKLKEPLVVNPNAQPSAPSLDVETGDEPKYVILGARAQRVSTATTVCLFLTALLVMSIGVIGGVCLYKQLAKSQMHRFQGWCNIPFSGGKLYLEDEDQLGQHEALLGSATLLDKKMKGNSDEMLGDGPSFFSQEFDLDLESESFEKIDVPDFGGGRSGRFIHDFNTNKTGIIDLTGNRCFVMPLNRQRVLLPRSMYDLINKMWNGYYEVDTEVVRETMRVVLPPITDLKDIGQYIAKECSGVPTYMLERYNSNGISKRSIKESLVFNEFAGDKISKMVLYLESDESP